ncbi:MAG: DUF3800 domain-containing protein, partial [Planctomycetes bacterium]|nr:DUF3800 domain-containing protein [Planctomycetota bacterium]
MSTPSVIQAPQKPGFGDYIVYVDESGDHSLGAEDSTYPMFVLAFCIFEKTKYVESAVPLMQKLKFKWFGHDMVVLHEREIRKSLPPFQFLMNSQQREQFLGDISGLIAALDFTVIAVAIRKEQLKRRYADRCQNPYNIALKYGLERV